MVSTSTETAANQPRKLLFLSQVLPYPPDGGVKIRTYHVLRLLCRRFEVTALCFYRSKGGLLEQDTEASVEALRRLCRVEAFPLPEEERRWRVLWDHARSLVRQGVYTRYTYDSAAYRSRLVTLLKSEGFDLVHADSLDLSGYFPLVADIPLVCVHHDVQSLLLRRRANVQESRFTRAYIGMQSRLMRNEEERWCPRVDLNVTVSEVDRQALAQIAPGGRYTVVPNGVDTDAFQPRPGVDQTDIVCVGGTTWFPNLDALRYFCEDILPHIREREIEAPVRWIGRCTEQEQEEFRRRYGVELTGYVDDIRPHVHAAACYVVPLRVGGGTRIKILDAWAMGKAVVSTSVGAEGLEAVDEENILLRDDPVDFAEAVVRVVENGQAQERLGQAGRETVERLYSWDVIGEEMLQTYAGLVNSPAADSPRSLQGS